MVEQFLTLLPDPNFAAEFFPDEVQFYIDAFKSSIPYLSGGHVQNYELSEQQTADGRVVVKVVQYVA